MNNLWKGYRNIIIIKFARKGGVIDGINEKDLETRAHPRHALLAIVNVA